MNDCSFTSLSSYVLRDFTLLSSLSSLFTGLSMSLSGQVIPIIIYTHSSFFRFKNNKETKSNFFLDLTNLVATHNFPISFRIKLLKKFATNIVCT